MGFPSEYKFTVPVGERFREPGYRELFFRLLTNHLTEQCARSLHLEGTRLDFKTSVLTGSTWFKAGRIELRNDKIPMTIECVLSIRRWSFLLPLVGCILILGS